MRRNRIANINDLEERISELESLRGRQQQEFKAEFREVAHRLSPATLIRNGVQSVVGDPELRTAAFDTAISNSAGQLGKRFVVRKSHNVIRKLAGSAVYFLIANFVRNKIPAFRQNIIAHRKGTS